MNRNNISSLLHPAHTQTLAVVTALAILCLVSASTASTWRTGGAYGDIDMPHISANGRLLFVTERVPTGTGNRTTPRLIVYDIGQNVEIGVLDTTLPYIYRIAATPDNATVLIEAGTPTTNNPAPTTLYKYDLATRTKQIWYDNSLAQFTEIAISGDGTEVIMARVSDSTVECFRHSLATGDFIDGFRTSYPTAPRIKLSYNGGLLAVYGVQDTLFEVIDTRTGQLRHSIAADSGAIGNIVFNSRSTACAVAMSTNILQVFSVETGQEILSIPNVPSSVVSSHPPLYSFCSNDSAIVFSTGFKSADMWNIFSRQRIDSLDLSGARPFYTPSYLTLIKEFSSCTVTRPIPAQYIDLYSPTTDQHRSFPPGFMPGITGTLDKMRAAFSHAGNKVSVSSPLEGRIFIRDVGNGSLLHTVPAAGIHVFGRGDSTLLVVADSTSLQEWHIASGTQLGVYSTGSHAIRFLRTSPHHPVTALVSDSSFALWDQATHQIIEEVALVADSITAARFSNDGRAFLTGTYEGKLYRWQATTGRLTDSLAMPGRYWPYYSGSYDISPNGMAVAAAHTRNVEISGLSPEATPVVTGPVHSYNYFKINSCLFSQDGLYVYTAASVDHVWGQEYSRYSHVKVFDAQTGGTKYDTVLPAYTYVAATAPSGRHLFTMACESWSYCLEMPGGVVSVQQRQQSGPGSLVVFPNPATGPATVRYTLQRAGLYNIDLALYTAFGQRVATVVHSVHRPGEYTAGIDASTLPAGVYYLVFATQEGKMSVPVTILR